MDELTIRTCTLDDVPLLAGMNRQLLEDEQYDKEFSDEYIYNRMYELLSGEYKGYLFTVGGQVVGYALVNPHSTPLYLRHFFICREQRRRGLGRQAFGMLLERLQTHCMDVEVMIWNERGLAFWRSLGFCDRSMALRLGGKSET